ncbi:related to 37S ribosomal protein S7, mitochondrial [Saccharomycodes ludwigii]|uniref:Small ribosomal subunit protein uS7m n=1 Tax=Saccharomycodes ludwigii TaxID=36035 RepID=A0A376B8Y5_9ASCO|nr:hypothetical protein SCDLUD_000078 [Saccharomycodes ludwigii]KAH3902501.1 hypothetical protein SCDLUD_000078 [Saccharomycodes ludwigii]SSD61136.1 related to 37S ribosomal protein S7, mitochondrial [Saccharomycodes ludwigii]
MLVSFKRLLLRTSSNAATAKCILSLSKKPLSQQIYRYQSTKTPANVDKSQELDDATIDNWLEAIASLKKEFNGQEYLPDNSLTPPGVTRLNIMQEVNAMDNYKKNFTPTSEQLAMLESLKDKPIPERSDPILQHVTNMIMRHGKRERASKILSRALYLVFIQLRQDPIEILKKCLDDLAPLMIVKTFKTGVAKAATIPVPLNKRQRNRLAWKWIVEGSAKRPSKDFSVRLGEELVSVYNGNSSGFEKRDSIHKTAIAHRAYIKLR